MKTTSLVASNTMNSGDNCLSDLHNSYTKVVLNSSIAEDTDENELEIIESKPKQKTFLEKGSQIVPFNKELANRVILKEDMEKKFSSLYVLNFVQDDDVFEYFKSIIDYDYNKDLIRNGKPADKGEGRNSKLGSVKDCKYLYMIVENPKNRQESVQLAVRVTDIVLTNSNSRY